MEKLTLQQLINETMDVLNQAGASNYYKTVFKTLTKQFLIYAKDNFPTVKKQVLLRNPIRYSACILSVFLHFSFRETF